ncbi:basic amino acid ABC transporter substrate-binding protein [Dehalococcoides mccartyi]|jgi:amino acid-binding protein|uniref:Amino acid ABC transporter, periplasmic aminoacid-binding protein n=1 Tax=Dehalococcoides mccartyi (strain CBDB1) TaxID=255470 RepID=A0A916KLX4_DEHMC|nr:basic amino acid ABC transporter substrate-binding protein [Dehalococcoides mccartyi]AQU05510.1 basic amino acid ABC transporter substrate-binding protein [Dehalococcoides mccartyi]AQU06956.1 basic amino acid ABC transporter substrate-binding protein [Dehalococcoides mccartyi]AQX74241.1 basic amino acid ABC transporter substrate-binding protein [Dehalococcoides mccartyi]AQY72817.1 basic amino acid ABC transporter substrate-binding protein [Dehalococcoides mccartyi]OBW63032.1 MAG: ABC transp
MKRLSTILMTLLLSSALLFSGCQSSTDDTDDSTATLQITVVTDATWAPFEYVNEQTHAIEGFDIDLMKAIAEKANLEVTFQNVAWDALLAGMATGQYKVAISSITILPDRLEKWLFSEPYFNAGQMVCVQKTNTTILSHDDLTGKRVAAQTGTTGFFEAQKIANATVKSYDEIGLAFQDLINGQIDAVICDNPVAIDYVNANPDKLKKVGTAFTDEYYGISVAKGQTEILSRINLGLAAVIADGTLDQLIAKWNLNP